MFRAIAALLLTGVLLSSARANLPYLAGGDKKPLADAPKESRSKIVDQLHADYEKVDGRLKKDDPGAVTRNHQKQIIAGLDKLIEDQDPEPNSNRTNPPQPQGNPPAQAGEQRPQAMPKPAASKPNAAPIAGQRIHGVKTIDGPKVETKDEAAWWRINLPQRMRQEMDAAAGQRFVPRYEELIRAYYRNIAESSQRKDD